MKKDYPVKPKKVIKEFPKTFSGTLSKLKHRLSSKTKSGVGACLPDLFLDYKFEQKEAEAFIDVWLEYHDSDLNFKVISEKLNSNLSTFCYSVSTGWFDPRPTVAKKALFSLRNLTVVLHHWYQKAKSERKKGVVELLG